MRNLLCLSCAVLFLAVLLPGTATAAPIVSVRVESLGPGRVVQSGPGRIGEFLQSSGSLGVRGFLEMTFCSISRRCRWMRWCDPSLCAGFEVILRAVFPTPSIARATTD